LKTVTDITGPNNSAPEVLHLLLELSDEPLNKTRLSDLDALVPPSPPKELTWEDIIAEDPLEGEIWDDVDFGAESSDAWSEDEAVRYLPIRERLRKASQESLNTKRRKRKKAGESSPEQDEEEGYRVVGVEGSILEGDSEGLEVLKGAQYWARKVAAKEEEIDVALGGTAERVYYHNPFYAHRADFGLSGGCVDCIRTAGIARSDIYASRTRMRTF
jgi:gamma-tubulin complex component 5